MIISSIKKDIYTSMPFSVFSALMLLVLCHSCSLKKERKQRILMMLFENFT